MRVIVFDMATGLPKRLVACPDGEGDGQAGEGEVAVEWSDGDPKDARWTPPDEE